MQNSHPLSLPVSRSCYLTVETSTHMFLFPIQASTHATGLGTVRSLLHLLILIIHVPHCLNRVDCVLINTAVY